MIVYKLFIYNNIVLNMCNPVQFCYKNLEVLIAK